jgi:hypothetical protein
VAKLVFHLGRKNFEFAFFVFTHLMSDEAKASSAFFFQGL